MRARLCYLALVLLPLVAYWPTLATEYATPEDFVRLQLGAAAPLTAQHGILHGALVEMSFQPVDSVAQLVLVRGLALVLVMLTGIALWQMLERGGWSEFDAGFVAGGLVLLPAAQLIVAWGAAWPAAMVRWLVDRKLRRRPAYAAMDEERFNAESDKSPGLLLSSGYIAGIVIAFLAGVPGVNKIDDMFYKWSSAHNPFFEGPHEDLLSFIPFALLSLFLYLVAREKLLAPKRTA
jgi:hypothetical protein